MRVNTLKCNTLYVGRSGDLSSAVSAAAIASLSGVTAGTVAASKALIVDASKDLAGLNDITCGAIDTASAEALVLGKATANAVTIGASDIVTTINGDAVVATDLDVGSSGVAGTIDVFPTTASKGKIIISAVDSDDDYTLTIKNDALGQSSAIAIPDPGAATAEFMLTTADNDGDPVDATAAEINAMCDMSGKVVAQGAGNFTFAVGTHENRITVVNDADVVITLPAATGTGHVYKFIVGATPMTSGLVSVTGNDTFFGGCVGVDDDADAAYAWKAEASDNEVNMSGTATGGKSGDWFEFIDFATDKWLVNGFITQSGGSEATPFDAAA